MEGGGDGIGFGAVAVGELIHDIAPRSAGGHRVDPDALRGEIHRLAAGQLQDGSFRPR